MTVLAGGHDGYHSRPSYCDARGPLSRSIYVSKVQGPGTRGPGTSVFLSCLEPGSPVAHMVSPPV